MLLVNSYNNSYKPNFGMYWHSVKDNMGNIVYRGDTRIFRNDLEWNKLVHFISDKYKNNDKVQILMHACSDGEEVYSFIAKLLEEFGENNIKKYLPIKAKDIDIWHIDLAKRGVYEMFSVEKPDALFYTNGNFSKYFFEENKDKYSIIHAKNNLKNKVMFEVGDILEDVKILSFNNTVLFARNFMPYLDREDAYLYVKNLAQKLDKTSTLIIGEYDKEFGLHKLLERFGFKETNVDCVYEIEKNSKMPIKLNDLIYYKNIGGNIK